MKWVLNAILFKIITQKKYRNYWKDLCKELKELNLKLIHLKKSL